MELLPINLDDAIHKHGDFVCAPGPIQSANVIPTHGRMFVGASDAQRGRLPPHDGAGPQEGSGGRWPLLCGTTCDSDGKQGQELAEQLGIVDLVQLTREDRQQLARVAEADASHERE